jgi:hypothetical protein
MHSALLRILAISLASAGAATAYHISTVAPAPSPFTVLDRSCSMDDDIINVKSGHQGFALSPSPSELGAGHSRGPSLVGPFTSQVGPISLRNSRGMTWASYGHDGSNGVDHVGCDGCDAYKGDTSCSSSLPLLCIHVDDSDPPADLDPELLDSWAGGHLALSTPIRGRDLYSRSQADARCAEQQGEGWRMAEFHDGWGWDFYAWGHLPEDRRFWVAIDDQRANCWDRSALGPIEAEPKEMGPVIK